MGKIKSVRRIIRSNDGKWIEKRNYRGKKVFVWSTFNWVVIDNDGKQYRRSK